MEPCDNFDDIQNLGIFIKVLMTGNSEVVSSQNKNYVYELPQSERKLDSKITDFITQCFKVRD